MSYLQSNNVCSKDMYRKANLCFVIYYPELISIFDFRFCKFIFSQIFGFPRQQVVQLNNNVGESSFTNC